MDSKAGHAAFYTFWGTLFFPALEKEEVRTLSPIAQALTLRPPCTLGTFTEREREVLELSSTRNKSGFSLILLESAKGEGKK
jgi:hypothetical protein